VILKKILLGLFVWLASVGVAYYFGTTIQSASTPEPITPEVVAAKPAPTLTGEAIVKAEPSAPTLTASSLLALSQDDLAEALRQASDLDEAGKRELLAEAFALPETDYRRSRMIRDLLGEIAKTAPLDALAMAEEVGSLRDTQRARESILETWAGNDPTAALAWAQTSLANEPLRSQTSQMLAIFRGYAGANPQAAFSSALAMQADTVAQKRLQNYALEEVITTQISNGGLLGAKLQVEQLEDGSTKSSLMSELVDRWASYDPEGAAAYVETLGDNASSSVKSRLLGEWAEKDPAAAAAWLNEQDFDERTLRNASTAIIREWTRYDMAASAEWLNSQPASDALDRAVMSYTYRAAQEDPASAMTWAQSIGNGWMRNRMMSHVAGNWKNDDPQAFQSFIETAEIEDDQKKKLQEAEASTGGSRYSR